MKKRVVIVMIELDTDLRLKDLQDKTPWQEMIVQYAPVWNTETTVRQVSANVAQAPKRVEAARKK